MNDKENKQVRISLQVIPILICTPYTGIVRGVTKEKEREKETVCLHNYSFVILSL